MTRQLLSVSFHLPKALKLLPGRGKDNTCSIVPHREPLTDFLKKNGDLSE